MIMKEKRNLLKIAVDHGLQKLMFKCEEAYLSELKVSNCLQILLVLDNFVPKSMTTQKVLAFIKKNFEEVSRDRHWEEFVENCSSLVRSIQSRQSRDNLKLLCIFEIMNFIIPHYGSLESNFKVMSLDIMEGF